MAYHLSNFPGGAVISVEGKMDELFLAQVQSAIDSGQAQILINLEKSQAIRGDHMEWMVEAHHLCDKAGGAMALTDVPSDFRYILSIMELDQFFRLFDTTAQGEQAFQLAPAPTRPHESVAPADVDELNVLELEPAAAEQDVVPESAGPPKTEGERRAEREMRVEMFVRHVAPGMPYLYVFDSLTKGGTKKFDIRGLSKASRQKASQVTLVVEHMVELRICKPLKRGLFQFAPRKTVQADISAFLKMWNNPNNHGKVYKWVYAEEQAQKSEQKPRSLSSKLKGLFGKG